MLYAESVTCTSRNSPDNSYEITKVKAEGKNNSMWYENQKPKLVMAFFRPTIVLSDNW